MGEPSYSTTPEFDSGPWATISSGMKILAKRGRLVVADGHLGLFRENGDLINSAPLTSVELKKGFTYALSPIPQLTVGGTKYKVMVSYERSIESGLGDQQAKEIQSDENDKLSEIIRRLGGKA